MTEGGATPRGIIARLRHQLGPLLPLPLRRAGARIVRTIEERHGATYEVAGQRVRFLGGAAPTVVATHDHRSAVDALQLSRFARAIRSGDVIADVGAYRGTYTVIGAACAGADGRVFAFEPTPANAQAIAASARLNNFETRIVIETVAVSDTSGIADFYAWGDATTNSLAHHHSAADAVQVRTLRLDDYFADRTLPRVVKIDIEGAELRALHGARSILASDAFIICELHPYAWNDFGYSADDWRALLEHYGRYTADLANGEEVETFSYRAVELRKRS
jgi:FkbM family methyltransferase